MPNKAGYRLIQDEDGAFTLDYVGASSRSKPSPSGFPYRPKYRRVFDEGRNAHFVKERDEDAYARIQSFLDGCLIDNLIKRYVNGDSMALQRSQGLYGDFSRSIDLRAAHDVMNQARSVFDALTQDEKALYNDNFENFMGTLRTDKGLEDFIQRRVIPTPNSTQEVTPNAE